MEFTHSVPVGTGRVEAKFFTSSFRKFYGTDRLDTSPGRHLYRLDLNGAGSLADGLYYLLVVDHTGGGARSTVMKVVVLK